MNQSTLNPSSKQYESKIKYTLLVLALGFLAVGFSNIGQGEFWELGRPIGAILFGLYMIATVLNKETALYLWQLNRDGKHV